MLKKDSPTIHHPPLALRQRILDQYYDNIQKIDRIDAHVIYDTDMHKLYCKYNPFLKYSGKDKYGRPIPRKMLTREFFLPKKDF